MSSRAIPIVPIKIHPRLPRGRFHNGRVAMVLLTQLLFFVMPWLTWHGRQAVLFDFPGSRFHLFGLTLLPQDFVYLAALLIFCAIALFWWTALAGRLWCGFSCPQTVYSQIMVWIERAIEGDRKARIALDAAPWSAKKLALRSASHGTMVAFSLATGFTFVGWFVPVRELVGHVDGWPLFWLLFYAAFTYLLAGLLREKVCLFMCPYARFQGVMFDKDTLVVSYDAQRGEPRGGLKKDATAPRGDCVDCGLCVQVCPTGIDIRHGLQYECINCAACIDACDEVMDKIAAPRGLIRFSSENRLAGKVDSARRLLLRPRVAVYGALMGIVGIATAYGFATRAPLEMNVLRDRAFLVRETSDGWLENGYTANLVNTGDETLILSFSVDGLPGAKLAEPTIVTLAPEKSASVMLRVEAPPEAVQRGSQPLRIVAYAADEPGVSVGESSRFIGE
ncbi:cytochrome c oxidase accessory protein CcoG [Crenobacter cavernae]|uniref:Cytochrome c oxidase accessory protein CcoG n=1 Tax=Crenobacter cavernae TaxID=2290923 RepID=A0A345Y4H1_9NEIS|nr:cytochrome c oxidase accessory protein CcoG [Crenobacter cavernae]AXK38823.1 cytochrome c oxidase accessory protein CcoG [Crenobacter cavernae]